MLSRIFSDVAAPPGRGLLFSGVFVGVTPPVTARSHSPAGVRCRAPPPPSPGVRSGDGPGDRPGVVRISSLIRTSARGPAVRGAVSGPETVPGVRCGVRLRCGPAGVRRGPANFRPEICPAVLPSRHGPVTVAPRPDRRPPDHVRRGVRDPGKPEVVQHAQKPIDKKYSMSLFRSKSTAFYAIFINIQTSCIL